MEISSGINFPALSCCNRRRRFQGNDSCLQILITTIFERSRRWCLALLQSESTWTIVVPCHDMAGQDWGRKTTCSTSLFLCNGNYPILWFPLALSKNPSLHTFIRSWEWAWVSSEILKSLLTWAFMFVVAINCLIGPAPSGPSGFGPAGPRS